MVLVGAIPVLAAACVRGGAHAADALAACARVLSVPRALRHGLAAGGATARAARPQNRRLRLAQAVKISRLPL
eukprot:9260710-Alexandrium_andersonii.AAC.1